MSIGSEMRLKDNTDIVSVDNTYDIYKDERHFYEVEVKILCALFRFYCCY